MSLVEISNKNVENGIDSDITNSSPDKWMDLKSNYDIDAKGLFDNDKSTNAFVCIAYTGDPKDEGNEGEF